MLYFKAEWVNEEIRDCSQSIASIPSPMIGKHYILELYDCDPIKLNDEAFVRTTITTSAKIAGATLINLMTHRFTPRGVTGLALLAESHISIHTWPEIGYGAVDIFTCGDHTMPDRACDVFIQEFVAQRHFLRKLKRATPQKLPSILRDSNY